MQEGNINHSLTCEQCFSLLANFFHMFDLKNVTSWGKWPNPPDFEKQQNKTKITRFL